MPGIATTIEINVPDDLLRKIANKVVEATFEPPSYRGDRGPSGYELVRSAVEKRISEVDLTPVVDEAINKAMLPIMQQLVEEKLKKIGRDVLKRMLEMHADQQMLDGVKGR